MSIKVYLLGLVYGFFAIVNPLTADEISVDQIHWLQALNPWQQRIAGSQYRVGERLSESFTATAVDQRGYYLSKRSEMLSLSQWYLFDDHGRAHPARKVAEDEVNDWLLLHAEMPPKNVVKWHLEAEFALGQWSLSWSTLRQQWAIGVISAKSRAIRSSGGALGLRFAADDPEFPGVMIEELSETGPARLQGVREGDWLMALAGHKVRNQADLQRVLRRFEVGSTLQASIIREGVEREIVLRIYSRQQVLNNWSGEDFGNVGVSVRSDGFAYVVQHDLPLTPEDMGSVLYDLEGRAIAWNVAKSNRVTAYALPASLWFDAVRRKIEQDYAATR